MNPRRKLRGLVHRDRLGEILLKLHVEIVELLVIRVLRHSASLGVRLQVRPEVV